MSTETLVYRGVRYDVHRPHEAPSREPVEHVYRGVHYSEALRHEPMPVDETIELHYRGHVYHQRQHQARHDLAAG
jgi:hypothetical protein